MLSLRGEITITLLHFLLFSDQDLEPLPPPPPPLPVVNFAKHFTNAMCIDTRVLNELNLFSYFPSYHYI